MLADRGLGLLATLRRVRPALVNDGEALRVAFTEVISGRAPEGRGNGLKYVRKVVAENAIDLLFQSGDAELRMKGGSADFAVAASRAPFRGCLALISY